MVKEAYTSPISAKKKIDTVNKTDKSQTSKETVYTSKNNQTVTITTIDKSRYIPGDNLSNRSTRIENPLSRTIKIFLICLDKEMINQV